MKKRFEKKAIFALILFGCCSYFLFSPLMSSGFHGVYYLCYWVIAGISFSFFFIWTLAFYGKWQYIIGIPIYFFLSVLQHLIPVAIVRFEYGGDNDELISRYINEQLIMALPWIALTFFFVAVIFVKIDERQHKICFSFLMLLVPASRIVVLFIEQSYYHHVYYYSMDYLINNLPIVMEVISLFLLLFDYGFFKVRLPSVTQGNQKEIRKQLMRIQRFYDRGLLSEARYKSIREKIVNSI